MVLDSQKLVEESQYSRLPGVGKSEGFRNASRAGHPVSGRSTAPRRLWLCLLGSTFLRMLPHGLTAGPAEAAGPQRLRGGARQPGNWAAVPPGSDSKREPSVTARWEGEDLHASGPLSF